MDAQTGQAAFRLGMLITAPAAALLLFLQPGTAEFVVTVMTLIMGLAFLGIVTLLVLRSQR